MVVSERPSFADRFGGADHDVAFPLHGSQECTDSNGKFPGQSAQNCEDLVLKPFFSVSGVHSSPLTGSYPLTGSLPLTWPGFSFG